ncbi:Arrestin domain-containing protein C31A2.12 [Hypsizygus marmoreus]|uniref:Arrestin domain-containing protein C31A2.12 n=1 Tax=Hypsizygus marmoreus TaxID=39966 RepID=A0A369J7X2_HYPMA|nr:Arrestin domain-containing protein C31A2.12 [Hypsizygus marmoreus]
MAFVLSRNASSGPPPREDPLIATEGASVPHVNQFAHSDHDMAPDREHKGPRIEILLDQPYLFLKGVGVDVEPTRLSGHVALYLTESTPIKEITLQFRGKAHLPIPPNEALTINAAPLTYHVCSYDWSFLEGEKKVSHTLKAGRHLFPFQLRIGGSLPSTISSPAFGGASVLYKLRAQAVRPGFAFNHNFQSVVEIPIIRSFAPEAMEYQQTLEIENTWPEKLMYSIMLPHKAWAAGDKITALVKFSPLVKGVCVLNVATTIHETTKVYARSGPQESARIVASTKHEIVNGRANEVSESRMGQPNSYSQPVSPASPASPPASIFLPENASVSSGIGGLDPASSYFPSQPSAQSALPRPLDALTPAAPLVHPLDEPNLPEPENSDLITYLSIHVPLSITPTHALEPITVSHRIRWSILILNVDGHTSELRCSLPLHLLDYRLLNESRIYSAPTRRLLLGGSEVPPEEEEEIQLPSYTAHVRDRVANMFLLDSATMRVTNPWISQGASPTYHPGAPPTFWPVTRSGRTTPLEAHLLTHLPHQPSSSDNAPLDWVNSELLLSLSGEAPPRLHDDSPPRHGSGTESAPLSQPHSRPSSRAGRSAAVTHLSSREGSIEREREHFALAPPPPAHVHLSSSHETYLHGGHASRDLHSLLNTSMKPFSNFSYTWMTRSPHTHNPPTTADLEREQRSAGQMRHMDPSSGTELLHRAFTEVPDYAMASRGFLGGVPPLSSMQGLPSYEETVMRTQSESDIAARFAAAGVHASASSPRIYGSVRSAPLRHAESS